MLPCIWKGIETGPPCRNSTHQDATNQRSAPQVLTSGFIKVFLAHKRIPPFCFILFHFIVTYDLTYFHVIQKYSSAPSKEIASSAYTRLLAMTCLLPSSLRGLDRGRSNLIRPLTTILCSFEGDCFASLAMTSLASAGAGGIATGPLGPSR